MTSDTIRVLIADDQQMVRQGFTVLLNAQKVLKSPHGLEGDQLTGLRIVEKSLEEPLRQICQNAGKEGSVIVEEVRKDRKMVVLFREGDKLLVYGMGKPASA